MRTIKGSVAVVTGAGSGLGRAIALELAKHGAKLAVSDVDDKGLKETEEMLAGRTECKRYVNDISDAAAVEAFAKGVERDFKRVSILVNNAGVAMIGSFSEISLAELEWIVNINFWGVVHSCKFFLPMLQQEPDAHIVTMCSLSALMGLSGQTHYSASKFAVRGFTEALRQELMNSNIKMTSVYPAGVRTGLVKNARLAASADPAQATEVQRLFAHLNVITPEKAAQQVISAVLRNKTRLLIGSHAYGLDTVQRMFPAKAGSIVMAMLRRM